MNISLGYKSAGLRPVSEWSDVKTLATCALSNIARAEYGLLNGRPGECIRGKTSHWGGLGNRSYLLDSCSTQASFIPPELTRDKKAPYGGKLTIKEWEQLKTMPFNDFLRWALTKLRTGQLGDDGKQLGRYNALIGKYRKERDEWADEMIRYAREIEI